MIQEQFLSIDVQAHLNKIAKFAFRSPWQFYLQIIRGGLKRNAKRIELNINSKNVIYKDDGTGIPPKIIKLLVSVFNEQLTIEEREAAIVEIKTENALELLALLATNRQQIEIENNFQNKSQKLIFKNDKLIVQNHASTIQGTVIRYYQKINQRSAILAQIKSFCRIVEAEIVLNGKKIPRKPLLSPLLIWEKICLNSGCHALVGIPAKTEQCRIWLLENSIPYNVIVHPPQNGMIFEATVESPNDDEQNLLAEFLPHVKKLYQRLLVTQESFDQNFADWISALIFRFLKENSSNSIENQLIKFRQIDGRRSISLTTILNKVQNETVYYLDAISQNFQNFNPQQTILILNATERDYLLNFYNLPLVPLPFSTKQSKFIEKLINLFEKIRKAILLKIVSLKSVPPKRLSKDEQKLISIIREYLQKENFLHQKVIQIKFIRLFGGFGWIVNQNSSQMILLNLSNQQLKLAMKVIIEKPEFTPLLFSLLD